MAEVQWIKLAPNMFDVSRSIKYIENITPGGDTILIIWIKLLCMAGTVNDGGLIYITPSVPYGRKDLAEQLKKPLKIVSKALDTFEMLDMISIDEEGFIQLTSWGKYQNIEGMDKIKEQNRKRVSEYRQRKKSEGCNVTGNVTSNITVTQGNAIEEEEEGDKEKEIHSFTLSREEDRQKLLGGSLGGGVVLLSNEQISMLLDELSIDEFNKYVAAVRDCELSGKHYKKKSHYQAILDMAHKDRKVKGGKNNA